MMMRPAVKLKVPVNDAQLAALESLDHLGDTAAEVAAYLIMRELDDLTRAGVLRLPLEPISDIDRARREIMRREKSVGRAKGGHAAAEALTPAQRINRARNAARARWGLR